MKEKVLIIVIAVLCLLYSFVNPDVGLALYTNPLPADSATVAAGKASFEQNCSGCHNFRQDGIGPQLRGLTTKVSADWILRFIKNPQQVISSGDKRANTLVKKYKVVMPSFASLKDNEINAIIAYLETNKLSGRQLVTGNRKGLSNPIPEPVRMSDLSVELVPVTQFPTSSDHGKMPLARITKLDVEPGTGASFVLDLRGKLYKLFGNKPMPYMDMARLMPKFIHEPGLGTGFGSFAFHPLFAANGLLYTTHTEPAGSAKADFSYADSIKVKLQWVLTEWKAANAAADTFSGTGRELFSINMVAPNHGVQEIVFNPFAKTGDEDFGLLYMGIGDGGSVENGFPFLVHRPEKIWGTILRIDPAGRNSRNGQYGIPPQNLFAAIKGTKKLGEIYAYGFRNPHRITWTRSGQMLASNIGHGNIESVNFVLKGHDYGWPVREGSFSIEPYGELNKVYPLPKNDSSFHITYPVAQYDHDEGMAISGGLEYLGESIPPLKGKFLFGDIYTGRLFYIDLAAVKQGRQAPVKEWQISSNGAIKTLSTLCGSKRVDLHFGRDAKGELYILTKADGRLYRLAGVREAGKK